MTQVIAVVDRRGWRPREVGLASVTSSGVSLRSVELSRRWEGLEPLPPPQVDQEQEGADCLN